MIKHSRKRWKIIGLFAMYLFACRLSAEAAASEQHVILFDDFVEVEDSCIELDHKIPLMSLLEQMPDTISVYAIGTEGAETPVSIPVSWKASPDYETTEVSYYLFQPDWDEEQYQLDPAYNMEAYTPFIEVVIEETEKVSAQIQMNHADIGSKKEGDFSPDLYTGDSSELSLEEGIANIVERAHQQVNISWTPLKSMKGYISSSGELTGTYTAGKTYSGVPYGQLIDSGKYIPHDASFDTFLNAVNQADSVFYKKRGAYDSKNSTYYGSDCSAFVSYAYGLPRLTTTMISQSSQFSKVKDNSVKNAQAGDCFNRAGRHVEMITDIVRDKDGAITAVEVCEQTPPKARQIVYTPEKLQTIIDSGYTLLRFKKRQSVETPVSYKGYHGRSSVSHLPAPAVRENQQDATCLEEGQYESVVYCSVCGKEISRKLKPIPVGAHVYADWTVTVEAGCAADGEQERSCTVCGNLEKNQIPALGHAYETTIVQGNCVEQGYTIYHCTLCGETHQENYTDAIGHRYENERVVPPTCTEKGFTEYSCTVCGDSYKDRYEEAKGHTYTYSGKEAEMHQALCKVCGSEKTEKHSYTDGKCVCGALPVDLKQCDLLLSSKSFTYTGNSKKPDVTVTDSKRQKTLKAGQDYELSYTNNIKAGTAAAVVKGKGDYKGTISLLFTINKAQNHISAGNISITASPNKNQSVMLRVQTKSGKVTFRSDNAKIKVDSKGKLTVAKNYAGKGYITVSSGDSNYRTVTKKVKVEVKSAANQIKASDITKVAAVGKKSFSLKATCSGGAVIKYSSSNPQVKVDQKGNVTVNPRFVGESTITLRSAAKGIYKAASKKIKVTVIPAIPRQVKGISPKAGQIKLVWKKIASADGYQVAYTTDQKFKSNVKMIKIQNGNGKETQLTKTITNLKKKQKYYVSIRAIQVVKGKTYYSRWHEVQAVKVK